MTQPNHCARCGKWAGAHATLPGQPTDHLCMCTLAPAEKAAPPYRGMLARVATQIGITREQAEAVATALISAQQAAQPVAPIKPCLTPDAQPVAGEPVAWRVRRHDAPDYWIMFMHRPVDALADPEREVQPLYTAAPAPVVPLTDERIWELVKDAGLDWHKGFVDDCNRYAELVKLAEAAHGIKAGKDGAK